MRTILFILQKEFIQIFRNKTMLPIIFIMPLVQMLVLVYAATLDMKNIEMLVVDKDLSAASRELTSKFEGSGFFVVKSSSFDLKQGENALRNDKADMVLHIPAGFERDLIAEQHGSVQFLINAINITAAGLTNAYASAILADFNKNIVAENMAHIKPPAMETIQISNRYWYNPEMNYKIYMLPGILVILVTVVGMFLSAFNLVREKEMGTIEQINVTPIDKYQFIAGKLIPFWIIALFELTLGLIVGKLLFDLPMLGNLFVLFAFAGIYLLAVLGLGLLISTVSNTQQQVMFVSFFFFLTFVMMSGIFTPVESMPDWARQINIINPLAYFMRVIRMNLLKGSDFADLSREFISLGIYAAIALSMAVWRYRKVA